MAAGTPSTRRARAATTYAGDDMTTDTRRVPLAAAALGLIGEGATPATLERRFDGEGARLAPGTADRLLERLLELGLVRVARVDGGERVFVPTSLGASAVADGLDGTPAVRLADLELLRTELLSTIAHELRTPLTVLRTSVGLLADPTAAPTDEQRRTLLATIERNTERMQRLVGDILDLARFRSGSIRLQRRRFDACELARAAIASIAPLADARRQRLRLAGCDAVIPVFGDHRRLEQALVNLVSNAQRFSDEGGEIVIAVEAVEGVARWRVTDLGPGIPEADLVRLFERFFVGRNDRNPVRDGIGLGLPTALAIAQAHGGTIEVESALGHGSTFTLVVPIDASGEVD